MITDFLDLSGVETVETDSIDAQARYFTIDGLKVDNPSKGIYIVVRGNKVTKEYVR